MKLDEIITEARIKDIQAIVDNAESRAHDDASEAKSAVSGDAILKHAHKELDKMGYDKNRHAAAKKILTREVARREKSGNHKVTPGD